MTHLALLLFVIHICNAIKSFSKNICIFWEKNHMTDEARRKGNSYHHYQGFKETLNPLLLVSRSWKLCSINISIIYRLFYAYYWRGNFPMTSSVRCVSWLVCLSVLIYQNGRGNAQFTTLLSEDLFVCW